MAINSRFFPLKIVIVHSYVKLPEGSQFMPAQGYVPSSKLTEIWKITTTWQFSIALFKYRIVYMHGDYRALRCIEHKLCSSSCKPAQPLWSNFWENHRCRYSTVDLRRSVWILKAAAMQDSMFHFCSPDVSHVLKCSKRRGKNCAVRQWWYWQRYPRGFLELPVSMRHPNVQNIMQFINRMN